MVGVLLFEGRGNGMEMLGNVYNGGFGEGWMGMSWTLHHYKRIEGDKCE